jgi:glucosamine 6-phosphate synthetase-like amidotransferase/phosphosugar isomerase protein
MCGVFGFVANGDHEINMTILEQIAIETEKRGPHAWGMAWINRNDRLCMFKSSGAISDSLGMLAMASDAKMLIGHTRYATQGDPENNLNNHPHASDGGWIVHNGMIPHYKTLIDKHRLNPVTDCDSEVLGLLIEQQTQGSLLTRCNRTAKLAASRPLVMLGLWKPGHLVACRYGNPLHIGETKSGVYLASNSRGLPGMIEAMPDGQAEMFSLLAS